MLHVFIGWDTREVEAYEICKYSLTRHSSEPVTVYPLMEKSLRASGLYTRAYQTQADGQRIDSIDGKPFSTDFSFTRFLVPEIARKLNLTGPVLYCDCDMLWLQDVEPLFRQCGEQDEEDQFAVSVVQHNYKAKTTVKMDGVAQSSYDRKLWSSLMMFNLGHPATQALTSDVVNEETGAYLHGFGWCKGAAIGPLAERWNWLPGVSPTLPYQYVAHPQGTVFHFTEGIPGMSYRWPTEFDALWEKEKKHLNASRNNQLGDLF